MSKYFLVTITSLITKLVGWFYGQLTQLPDANIYKNNIPNNVLNIVRFNNIRFGIKEMIIMFV